MFVPARAQQGAFVGGIYHCTGQPIIAMASGGFLVGRQQSEPLPLAQEEEEEEDADNEEEGDNEPPPSQSTRPACCTRTCASRSLLVMSWCLSILALLAIIVSATCVSGTGAHHSSSMAPVILAFLSSVMTSAFLTVTHKDARVAPTSIRWIWIVATVATALLCAISLGMWRCEDYHYGGLATVIFVGSIIQALWAIISRRRTPDFTDLAEVLTM